jgi:hypothetical protein
MAIQPEIIVVEEGGVQVVRVIDPTKVGPPGPPGEKGDPGDGVAGNNDVGVIYLKNNSTPTTISAINGRAVVQGSMLTGELHNFAKDTGTNSLKYSGPGGKFHVIATFNFTTGSQNVCGFYIGHNKDESSSLDATLDRISESEIYVNSATTANQPVGGAIQSVLELEAGDRIFFIVQNQAAATSITVQFLKLTATSLTAEKGDQALYKLDDLTDVSDPVGGSKSDGDVLEWTEDTSRWERSNRLTALEQRVAALEALL